MDAVRQPSRAGRSTEWVALVQATTESELLANLGAAGQRASGSSSALVLVLASDGTPRLATLISGFGAAPTVIDASASLGLLTEVLDGSIVNLESSDKHPDGLGGFALDCGEGPVVAVPLLVDGDVLGALCLVRRKDEPRFDAKVLEQVEQIGIGGATLLRRMRRQSAADLLIGRMRRPRNVDIGLAASYVEESVTLRRLLVTALDVVRMDIVYLSSVDESGELATYAQAADSEGELSASAMPPRTGLTRLTAESHIPPWISDLSLHPLTAELPFADGLASVAYSGVPVRLEDGTLYGALCGVSRERSDPLSSAQLYSLRAVARLVGAELTDQAERERVHRREREVFGKHLETTDRRIHLQPIVDLATGRPSGYEALSRFTDLDGNPRRPDLEFEEATRLGYGVELEHAMLCMALSHLGRLPQGRYLSVNLSPAALLAAGAVDKLTTAVRLHPDSVVLELTEHEQVADYDSLLDLIAELRRSGLRLAIDDTGAGYSSLQHVTNLRPDILKLDATFGRDIDQNLARRAAARAMIGFAAEIGADLVAEGIETSAELRVLRGLGASHGQGYFLGRPMPVADALVE